MALLVGASAALLCFVLCCILLAFAALSLLESAGSVIFGLLGFGLLLVIPLAIPLAIWLIVLAAMFSLAVGGRCAAMFRSPAPASERPQATKGGRLLRGLLLACPLLLLVDLAHGDSLVAFVLKQFGMLLSLAGQLFP